MGAASWRELQRIGGGAVPVTIAATTAWRRGGSYKRGLRLAGYDTIRWMTVDGR